MLITRGNLKSEVQKMNDLRLIVLDNIEEVGNKVNDHLKELNNNHEDT